MDDFYVVEYSVATLRRSVLGTEITGWQPRNISTPDIDKAIIHARQIKERFSAADPYIKFHGITKMTTTHLSYQEISLISKELGI